MIVVADTSPILYLVLIDHVALLESLYGSVIIPDIVAGELGTPASPAPVRSWMSELPVWVRVESATAEQLSAVTPELDPGERAAIALATAFSADLLLIDDARGRVEAHRRRLALTGTLGVLRSAAERGLLDVPVTLDRLRATNFYVDSALIEDLFGRWMR
jgi:predicted nucleic acid-binding protein